MNVRFKKPTSITLVPDSNEDLVFAVSQGSTFMLGVSANSADEATRIMGEELRDSQKLVSARCETLITILQHERVIVNNITKFRENYVEVRDWNVHEHNELVRLTYDIYKLDVTDFPSNGSRDCIVRRIARRCKKSINHLRLMCDKLSDTVTFDDADLQSILVDVVDALWEINDAVCSQV
jgi:hypothetical protein